MILKYFFPAVLVVVCLSIPSAFAKSTDECASVRKRMTDVNTKLVAVNNEMIEAVSNRDAVLAEKKAKELSQLNFTLVGLEEQCQREPANSKPNSTN